MDNNFLSMRIKNATESATLAMTRLSRELRAKGKEIITLSIGEPDFNTPEPVKEAAIKAINDNITHYTPVAGFNTLREAIDRKLKRDNNLDFTREQIVVSNGAKQSPANIFLSILKDELAGLVSVLEKYKSILIVSYEIYEYINFKGKHCSIASFNSVKERVVVVNGVSKGYAMTGWRSSKTNETGLEQII